MDWFCRNLDFCSIRERAEIASSNAEDVSAKMIQTARLARYMAQFINDTSKKAKMLDAAGTLENLGNGIAGVVSFHGNVDAIYGIYTALDGLDAESIRDNPQQSARAFGRLFVHAGTLAAHLPPPLNIYARFLSGAGDFFENMRDMMDPMSPNTPRGRAMREALRAH